MSPAPDVVYALISDIMGVAARYSDETLKLAQEYARSTLNGNDRDAILGVLTELRQLKERRSPSAGVQEQLEGPVEPMGEVSPRSRELRAVLLDTTFLPSKADVSEFGTRHLGRVGFRSDPKDSRARSAERIVSAFERLPDEKQRPIYQAIRRAYLKDRQSSLGEWSDIIDKPAGR